MVGNCVLRWSVDFVAKCGETVHATFVLEDDSLHSMENLSAVSSVVDKKIFNLMSTEVPHVPCEYSKNYQNRNYSQCQ